MSPSPLRSPRALALALFPLAAACASVPAAPPRPAPANTAIAPPASPSVEPPVRAAATRAQDAGGADAERLAKQLSNPIASLTSVPAQFNWDGDVGPSEGDRLTVNVQPVVPFEWNDDWNLISRTILPVIHTDDVPLGEDEFGLGDTLQSLFFSPKAPTADGWIWGAGPVLLIPTATDETLGQEQFGVGPTGVILRQEGPWTYGALANHVWRVAGDGGRADVNATFVQPFLTYTTPEAWTYALNAEATYDWTADELALPLNLQANKVLNLGGQLVQLGGGVRYWVEDSTAGPEGFGLRFNLVLLFPK